MTTDQPADEPREAPHELLALAVAVRPDWDRDETWNSLLAVRPAWPWPRILRETIALMLRPGSEPRELRDAVRSLPAARTDPERGVTAEERDELRSEALAACEAASERFRGQARDAGSAA